MDFVTGGPCLRVRDKQLPYLLCNISTQNLGIEGPPKEIISLPGNMSISSSPRNNLRTIHMEEIPDRAISLSIHSVRGGLQ